MAWKFKKQQYQTDAVASIVDIFTGQPSAALQKGILSRDKQGMFVHEENYFANADINLSPDELLKNIKTIQQRNGLFVDKEIKWDANKFLNFSVEMETGTGKTYVYTDMIFNLHKHYGWSKFIIMVPSIAIREGVKKSLEITQDHFYEEYKKKIRFFIYDNKNKSNLINIKNFGTSGGIEVMIMNYQAFSSRSREGRKIFQKLDQIQSQRPIDIIKKAKPILIIDEPQRFGGTAEKMFEEFDPLFITRFSATHKKDREFNKVYRLDAIDAFNEKLVKKIKVIGIDVDSASGVNSFLFLDKIHISKNEYPKASIHLEVEVKGSQGIVKKVRKFKEGDDLYQYSGLEQYQGFVIAEINGLKNIVRFTNGVEIGVGQVHGDVDEKHIRRLQIRETIRAHIEKEREMFKRGIKVLSLFFIDEVKKYRDYDKPDNKGDYAKMFEEEYQQIISERQLFDEEYNRYLDKHPAEKVHNGYFSIDKKGKFVDSKEKRGLYGSDDVNAYDLIMKNKERLLSFDEPTRFIFSHSALREGWDNPNIFQICTLKHAQSEISKRQEIGRGLRIAVDKDFSRMDRNILEAEFFDINQLTVVASESYDSFARALQDEIFKSLSDRPRKLTVEVLKDRILKNKEGKEFKLTNDVAMNIIFDLKMKGYVDEEYKITEKFIDDLEKDEVEVLSDMVDFKDDLIKIVKKVYDVDNFEPAENASDDNLPTELQPNNNFAKKEFQDLWNKIRAKSAYTVKFDDDELIKKSVNAINSKLKVREIKVVISEGEQREEINENEQQIFGNTRTRRENLEQLDGNVKYDLIGEIADNAKLTRKTAAKILAGININSFVQFKKNPEDFIRKVSELIREEKATTLIEHIQYNKLEESYDDEIFTINNFNGSLKTNVLEVKKHIYDYVKTDSKVERKFTEAMESGEEVFIYAKLPHKFKIPTPVGNYNPDWAIVFNTEDVKYIYFIAETKGSMSSLQLKKSEELKIEYAKKHFELLKEDHVRYGVIDSYQSLINVFQ